MSVITAAYNRADLLPAAIRSVAEQTLPVLEHIIVDDGSTDGTSEIVQELRREMDHLVYFRQSRQGAGVARNVGIEAARGKYIAFLDSDDFWLPRKLERQMTFMVHHSAVFSYGDYLEHDRVTQVTRRRVLPPVVEYRDLLYSCPIGCLTAAYDQEALGKVYMPTVERGQDWGLWLALTRNGNSARKYPGAEAVYCCGSGGLSANKLRKSIDMYRIYRNYEQIGALRSLWHLGRHALYVLGK